MGSKPIKTVHLAKTLKWIRIFYIHTLILLGCQDFINAIPK